MWFKEKGYNQVIGLKLWCFCGLKASHHVCPGGQGILVNCDGGSWNVALKEEKCSFPPFRTRNCFNQLQTRHRHSAEFILRCPWFLLSKNQEALLFGSAAFPRRHCVSTLLWQPWLLTLVDKLTDSLFLYLCACYSVPSQQIIQDMFWVVAQWYSGVIWFSKVVCLIPCLFILQTKESRCVWIKWFLIWHTLPQGWAIMAKI